MINTGELINSLSHVSKSSLEAGLFDVVRKFHWKHSVAIPQSPETEATIAKFHSKKSLTRQDVILLSYSVFQNNTIFRAFMQSLPPAISRVMEKLIWVESITSEEAETMLGETIITPPDGKYGSYKLRKEFYVFDVKEKYFLFSGSKPKYVFSIPAFLKKTLIGYYPQPAHYNLLPLDEIPETDFRFTAENLIFHEMPRLLSYCLQGGIKFSASGKPADGTINKMQRTLNLTEITIGDDEMFGKIRTTLLAGMMYNFKVKNASIDTVSVIKELFTKQYLRLRTSQFVLMHLKGWAYVKDYEYNAIAELNFQKALQQLPVDKWITTSNLIDYIQYRMIDVQPIEDYALHNRLYYEEDIKGIDTNYKGKKYAGDDKKMLVLDPFIKGTVFLLASFGLIEIAYNRISTEKTAKTFYTGYDGLQYLKLTALGAYALGLSASYQPVQAGQQNKLQFSEDSLMILAEGDMGVLDIMLASYTEKAGNNRFTVTHAHFLKDCKNKKDIENKIALFRNTVSAKIPAYWELQFKTWLENAVQLKNDHQTKLFKIPPEAKELQRLVAQDGTLKTLILKAERFYILVPANNVARFKNRMKEIGYLVE